MKEKLKKLLYVLPSVLYIPKVFAYNPTFYIDEKSYTSVKTVYLTTPSDILLIVFGVLSIILLGLMFVPSKNKKSDVIGLIVTSIFLIDILSKILRVSTLVGYIAANVLSLIIIYFLEVNFISFTKRNVHRLHGRINPGITSVILEIIMLLPFVALLLLSKTIFSKIIIGIEIIFTLLIISYNVSRFMKIYNKKKGEF